MRIFLEKSGMLQHYQFMNYQQRVAKQSHLFHFDVREKFQTINKKKHQYRSIIKYGIQVNCYKAENRFEWNMNSASFEVQIE